MSNIDEFYRLHREFKIGVRSMAYHRAKTKAMTPFLAREVGRFRQTVEGPLDLAWAALTVREKASVWPDGARRPS